MSESARIPSAGRPPAPGLVGVEWAAAAWPSRWTVLHVAETGSTNDDLLDALERGAVTPPVALAAGFQRTGRGRLDRRWSAPAGANLLVTLAATGADHDESTAANLMHRVGLAAVAAIEHLARRPIAEVGLKWPNDVMLGDRKLAGVLAQARSSAGGLMMVVGIGLNVGWAPDGAASLRADVDGLGDVETHDVLAALLHRFEAQGADIGERYRERLHTIGRRVRVELPVGAPVLGEAVDVDERGRLAVRVADGTISHFDVGDVVHLMPG